MSLNTKRIIAAPPSHGKILELGASGQIVQIADNAQFKQWPIEAIAAAGNNQATGTALVAGHLNVVSGADGTKGVTLPAAAESVGVLVYNAGTSALPVYPASSDDINDGTANAAISLPAKSTALLVAHNAETWVASYPTVWVAADTTLADGTDFIVGTTTGTKIGTGVTQKIGFWNATPVVQPSSADQAAVTATAALTATAIAAGDAPAAGSGADGTTPNGAEFTAVTALANELKTDYTALLADVTAIKGKVDANVTLLNAIRTALVNAGLMKGSA